MKPGRPSRGRESLRDTMLRHQNSMNLYADLAGKPRVQADIPPPPKKRAPSVPTGIPLEKDVQKAIIDGLRMHPMVGLVERINSGVAEETNEDGDRRFIAFNHVFSVGGRGRMRAVDLHCTLKPSGRRFVVEVKRPGWRGPHTERELQQLEYIQHVRDCGGFGMFACSWDEVVIELQRIRGLL